MPSLLDLPRELRDQICIYALLSPTAAPNIDASFEELIVARKLYRNLPRLRAWSDIVLYDPLNSTVTPPSLLFVNRQMRHETISNLKVINRLPNCSMDLVIADEIVLLPTWTQLPYRHAPKFNTVDVTFRISGAFNKWKDYPFDSYRGFRIGDGAGPAMGWQLYALLERFIRVGTKAEGATCETHVHTTAKTIRIDVQTPTGIDSKRFNTYPVSSRWYDCHRVEMGDVLNPTYLAEFVGQHLEGLLSTGSYEWFTYGQILYEHVDELVVCQDGREIRRWDVAKYLSGRQVEVKYFSPQDMETYKQKAWELRKLRGLKVIESTSSP